jgi:hypothetical protein
MLGHEAAAIDLLPMYLARPRARINGVTRFPDRPGEIDRRRPRGQQEGRGLVEVLPALGGERVPVCGGDADRRRAAHRQRPNRLGNVRGRPAFELDLLVGQAPLVEDDDAILFQPNDLFWL